MLKIELVLRMKILKAHFLKKMLSFKINLSIIYLSWSTVISLRANRCKIGKTKAPVLPEPVVAQAQISLPCRATGIQADWIGVGAFQELFPSPFSNFLSKLNSENVSSIFLFEGLLHSSKKSSSSVFLG